MTDTATVGGRLRRWRRRAIIGIVTLMFLSPLLAIRQTREEYCPICGRWGSSTLVWILNSFTIRMSHSECIGGEHAWFVSSYNTTPFQFTGGGMHVDAFLFWDPGTKFLLRPWFLEDPGGEDRQLVRRALTVATRKEVDEILDFDKIWELCDEARLGGDPEWSERLPPWASRVLARDGEHPGSGPRKAMWN